MPRYLDSVDWCAHQLKKVDWITRNEALHRLKVNRRAFFEKVADRLSPDQALAGKSTGIKLPEGSVIVAKDKRRDHKYRQVLLSNYFTKCR